VSGFGLAGHLLEMLDRSGAAARLRASDIPRHPGVDDLLRRGVRSTFHGQNTGERTRIAVGDGVDPDVVEALFDPQTSGGLLMGVPADRVAATLDALRAGGDEAAAEIGVVEPPTPGTPRLTLDP
jgi:selenide,water dikinase